MWYFVIVEINNEREMEFDSDVSILYYFVIKILHVAEIRCKGFLAKGTDGVKI